PEDLKKDDMLNYYSTQLSSVEINYTFRRFPTEKTVEKWKSKAAPGFVFTLKANQRITHWKKLEDVGEDVRDFVARGQLLGDRFGCVLFQCPPSMKYDGALLDSFLATLPAGGPSYAMEFRHDSWAAARDRLLDAGVGWCVAETDDKDPKPEDLSWEPVGYLRLRKTEYSDDELREWAGRIQPALDGGATIFCYFKHEDEGASPKMAKRLEAMLDIPAVEVLPQAESTSVEAATPELTLTATAPTSGKTQYFTATSIDGYIADPDNSLDWLFQAHQDDHDDGRWDAFIGGVGAMAMGATTYEWILEHEKLLDDPAKWREFYGDIPSWVFSHRDLPAIPNAEIRFVQGDVGPVHDEMKAAAAGKNIWLVGGGELVGRFADEGLLDEIQLHVAPVTLGGGAPLLPRRITAPRLALANAEIVGGFAHLTYTVASGSSAAEGSA
ncbi:MAG TPA: DUF72 domain-containing protein, partial [Actinomycetota bacterium]|nr:DUF72 domain-containing protein [Actinomycetota bacterium]